VLASDLALQITEAHPIAAGLSGGLQGGCDGFPA